MKRGRNITLAAALAVLAGCAATTGEGHILTEDLRAATGARSCCRSIGELLGEAESLPQATINLAPGGRHFAFSTGLSPYAVYRIPPNDQLSELAVLSHWRQRGWIEGGDGITHFANTLAVFLDVEGRLLPSQLVAKQQVATSEGRALQKRFSIPRGAAYVVLTTDPSETGIVESSTIKDQRDLPLVAGRTVFFLPGGLLPADYRLTTYGPVSLQVTEATSRLK